MVYTVTFNPALDYVLHMDHFQTGGLNRTQSEEIHCGGKGVNVSTVLKNLGVEMLPWVFWRASQGRRWSPVCKRPASGPISYGCKPV